MWIIIILHRKRRVDLNIIYLFFSLFKSLLVNIDTKMWTIIWQYANIDFLNLQLCKTQAIFPGWQQPAGNVGVDSVDSVDSDVDLAPHPGTSGHSSRAGTLGPAGSHTAATALPLLGFQSIICDTVNNTASDWNSAGAVAPLCCRVSFIHFQVKIFEIKKCFLLAYHQFPSLSSNIIKAQ